MTKLNERIDHSNFNLPAKAGWWYDNDHRRQYIYETAIRLLIAEETTPNKALEAAQDLDKLFYDRYYNPTTRKELNNG